MVSTDSHVHRCSSIIIKKFQMTIFHFIEMWKILFIVMIHLKEKHTTSLENSMELEKLQLFRKNVYLFHKSNGAFYRSFEFILLMIGQFSCNDFAQEISQIQFDCINYCVQHHQLSKFIFAPSKFENFRNRKQKFNDCW